jgi:hypothetical protein
MDWKQVRASFDDELYKISEISLSGLSTETTLQNSQPPPPMESPGFQKARAILDMMGGDAKEKLSYSYYNNQFPRLAKGGLQGEPTPPPDKIDKLKSLGAHVLAGGGAGRFASEFSPKGATPKERFIGTAVGAGLGAAEYARKRYRIAKLKKQSQAIVESPGISLRSGQQVGKFANKIHGGPGIKSQIAGQLIGRKYT